MSPLISKLTRYTLAWVFVYFPLETFVTMSIAGLGGLTYASYVMDVVGMGLLLWGVLTARAARPHAPAVLTAGWSWTAATFWRATADRFWYASLGHPLQGGPIELYLAPTFTMLALIGLAASLVVAITDGKKRSAY